MKAGSPEMSLHNDLEAEVASTAQNAARSKILNFLDTLPPEDRADFDGWIANPSQKAAMYRVLKRRGLEVAEVTFRNWVVGQGR